MTPVPVASKERPRASGSLASGRSSSGASAAGRSNKHRGAIPALTPATTSTGAATGASAGKRSKRVPFDGRCHLCHVTGWSSGPAPADAADARAAANKSWYCQTCVSKRIDDHQEDCRRITDRKLQARALVEIHLGPETTEARLLEQAYSSGPARGLALLDPFTDGDTGERGGEEKDYWPVDESQLTRIGHIHRLARAIRFRLQERKGWLLAENAQAKDEIARARERIAQKRQSLAARRRNLADIRKRELTEPPDHEAAFTGPGAWPAQPVLDVQEGHAGIRQRVSQAKEELAALEAEAPRLCSAISR